MSLIPVESAVSCRLQMKQLLSNHQPLNIAESRLSVRVHELNNVTVLLHLQLHSFSILNILLSDTKKLSFSVGSCLLQD